MHVRGVVDFIFSGIFELMSSGVYVQSVVELIVVKEFISRGVVKYNGVYAKGRYVTLDLT